MFKDLEETWDEFRLEPEAYFDLGEHTLTFTLRTGGEGRAAWKSSCRPPPLGGGATAWARRLRGSKRTFRSVSAAPVMLDALSDLRGEIRRCRGARSS